MFAPQIPLQIRDHVCECISGFTFHLGEDIPLSVQANLSQLKTS